MRRTVVVCAVMLLLIGSRASGQTRVFVSGAMFGEFKLTGQGAFFDADNSSFGGGARAGALFNDRWSLEIAFDFGGETSQRPIYYALAAGALENLQAIYPDLPSLPLTIAPDRETTRLTTVSTLVGFHPAAGGRVRPGFKGGLTFVREAQTSGGAYISPFIYPGPDLEFVRYGPAATVGFELAIDLTKRLAVVPEMRAHAFGGQIVLRPGAAVRWELK
jgi:hypothetical protein